MCLVRNFGEAETIDVMHDRNNKAVGEPNRNTDVDPPVSKDLVNTPGGVDLRVSTKRRRASLQKEISDADPFAVRGETLIDLGAERQQRLGVNNAREGEVRGFRALAEPLGREPADCCERNLLDIVFRRGRTSSESGLIRCSRVRVLRRRVGGSQAADGRLDVCTYDPPTGPTTGDRVEVDVVAFGERAGKRRRK